MQHIDAEETLVMGAYPHSPRANLIATFAASLEPFQGGPSGASLQEHTENVLKSSSNLLGFNVGNSSHLEGEQLACHWRHGSVVHVSPFE